MTTNEIINTLTDRLKRAKEWDRLNSMETPKTFRDALGRKFKPSLMIRRACFGKSWDRI